MQYDSSQYDATEFEPIPDGEYAFEVVNAEEQTSAAGNQMLSLELAVNVGRAKLAKTYDYLVAAPRSLWKIHTFCSAVGLDFHANELMCEHCLGRTGLARFEMGSANRNGRRYLEVSRYIEATDQPAIAPAATPPAGGPSSDDDLPF